MKIVIAPDSFKGSVSAIKAAIAIEKGVIRALPNAKTRVLPVADGGEGTMECLVAATNGRKVQVCVTGPLGKSVEAEYGWLGDNQTCVIEMASASGLCLISEDHLNPLISTTFGTGELIKHALDQGCRNFILALGGSATNDGGAGMLQALGMKLLDFNGVEIGFGGGELSRIAEVDSANWDERIKDSAFCIASDVQNPLIGDEGASVVYGPQKGASKEMISILERNMHDWADKMEEVTSVHLHDLPGAGAAGGLSGAFSAFFPSKLKRGIDIVLEYSGFDSHIHDADLVITGEGRIDYQTSTGKTPMGVAQKALSIGVPTFALAGSVGLGSELLYQCGIQCIHSIVDGPMTLEEAMKNAEKLLEKKAEQVVRTYLVGKSVTV